MTSPAKAKSALPQHVIYPSIHPSGLFSISQLGGCML